MYLITSRSTFGSTCRLSCQSLRSLTVQGSTLRRFTSVKPFDTVVTQRGFDESEGDGMANEVKAIPRDAGSEPPDRRGSGFSWDVHKGARVDRRVEQPSGCNLSESETERLSRRSPVF